MAPADANRRLRRRRGAASGLSQQRLQRTRAVFLLQCGDHRIEGHRLLAVEGDHAVDEGREVLMPGADMIRDRRAGLAVVLAHEAALVAQAELHEAVVADDDLLQAQELVEDRARWQIDADRLHQLDEGGDALVGEAERLAATQPEQPAGDGESGAVATIAEKTVSVAAAADWTSTEIRVQRGQRIVINASGEVDLGDNQRTGPDGLSLADTRKLIAARPTGALIAVVGDDNDDFIFVGKATEFTAPHNGILFLSVNEGNLKDNAGAFVARVKVLTNK